AVWQRPTPTKLAIRMDVPLACLRRTVERHTIVRQLRRQADLAQPQVGLVEIDLAVGEAERSAQPRLAHRARDPGISGQLAGRPVDVRYIHGDEIDLGSLRAQLARDRHVLPALSIPLHLESSLQCADLPGFE